jgi:hypothetical protein
MKNLTIGSNLKGKHNNNKIIYLLLGFVASVQQENTSRSFVQNQAAIEQKDLKAVDFGSINCPFLSILTSSMPTRLRLCGFE